MQKHTGHTHTDEHGALVRCYHQCKTVLTDWKTYVAITVSYPIEHLLWEKVPGFHHIAEWLGMH